MDRHKKKLPETCVLDEVRELLEVPEYLHKQPLEELLYMVDTCKLNVVDKNKKQLAIMDFWMWSDQFISMRWYRSYSKLRSMGYKFKGNWFVNPSKTSSFYILPVNSNDKLDILKDFAFHRLERPVNPFVNAPIETKTLPDYQIAIQYFQSEIRNCENGMLLSIFDKDDTFMISLEQVNLKNDKLEKQRTIRRRNKSAFT